MHTDGFDCHEDHRIIPLKRKIAYGIGGMNGSLVGDFVAANILYFYNIVMGMDARMVGIALFVPRLWDTLIDPFLGQLSDNFRSRWGRRRPFVLFGGLVSCVLFALLWAVPPGLSEQGRFYYLLITYFGFTTFSGLGGLAYGALGMELSTDYNERTRIFMVQTVFSRVAALIVAPMWWVIFSSGWFASPRIGFASVCALLAAVSAVVTVVVFMGTREEAELQRQPRTRLVPAFLHTLRNGPFVLFSLLMFVLYLGVSIASPFVNYLAIYRVFNGDMAGPGKLFAVISYVSVAYFFVLIPIFGWIGLRVGKRNALQIGFLVATTACLSSWWLITPEHPWLLVAFVLLMLPANVAAAIFPQAMLADTVDLDELRTGMRREGIYAAVFAFLQKLIGSSTVLITGFCLHWIGFDEKATVQTDASLFQMRIALVALPVASIAVASILLWRYPLGSKEVEQIRKVLEERREARVLDEEGMLFDDKARGAEQNEYPKTIDVAEADEITV